MGQMQRIISPLGLIKYGEKKRKKRKKKKKSSAAQIETNRAEPGKNCSMSILRAVLLTSVLSSYKLLLTS